MEFHSVYNQMEIIQFEMKRQIEMKLQSAHREIFSKSNEIKPKSDCIYHFPIDLKPNGQRPFGFKSIGIC